MRVMLDLDKKRIIIPKTFFPAFEKQNNFAVLHGGKKIEAKDHIKSCFDVAIEQDLINEVNLPKRGSSKKDDDKGEKVDVEHITKKG